MKPSTTMSNDKPSSPGPVAWVHPAYMTAHTLAWDVSPVRLSDQQLPLYLSPPESEADELLREALGCFVYGSQADRLMGDRIRAYLKGRGRNEHIL